MLRPDRIILLNAIALAVAMLAAVIGGLVASSWIWAIACAVVVYAGFRVGAMIWLSHKIRRRLGRRLRLSIPRILVRR